MTGKCLVGKTEDRSFKADQPVHCYRPPNNHNEKTCDQGKITTYKYQQLYLLQKNGEWGKKT
jgi:hypothetical protein